MNRILNYWLVIIFILSFIAILSALIAEFFFNLEPCKMCLNQRYTYYTIIFFTLLYYLFFNKKNIFIYLINQAAIIYGLFYALWHTGIEQKIFRGPTSCSGDLIKTESIQELKNQILNQSIISCSDISWKILGFSAANINSFLLLFILIFNSIYIYNYYNKKNAQ